MTLRNYTRKFICSAEILFPATLFVLTACTPNPSCRFHWNELEGYGTYYPAEFCALDFAENGKGFSASDGTATLWADTCLFLSLEDLPADFPAEIRQPFEEDGMIGAVACLQGKAGPECVSDSTTETDGIRERRKTVACGTAFYTVCYSYPVDKAMHYGAYEGKIFDTFPVWEKE